VKIRRSTLDTCSTATGVVIVIDVLRAFTTSAFLFDSGVEEILLVSSIEDAFELHKKIPNSVIAGEVNGIQVPGFDMGNSPSTIEASGKPAERVILRTTAGTQGVILAEKADTILTASLTNVSATVQYIQTRTPSNLTLIQTGLFPEEGWGDEDAACADAIESMLMGKDVHWDSVVEKVRRSKSGSVYDGTHPDFPPRDLELALRIDRFNFAMLVEKKDNLHKLHAIPVLKVNQKNTF